MTPSPKPLSPEEIDRTALDIMRWGYRDTAARILELENGRCEQYARITSQASEITTLTTAAESATKMLGNATRLVAELEAEIAGLKGRERTPGAVEQCEHCGATWDGQWPGYCSYSVTGNFRPRCPIRAAQGEDVKK